MNQIERYYKPAEIAEALSVSRRTVERWMADGRLPSIEICGIRRVSERAFRAFIGQQQPGAVKATIEYGQLHEGRTCSANKQMPRQLNSAQLYTPDGKIAGRRKGGDER